MPVVAEHFNPSLASPSPICKYLSFKCLTHFSSKKMVSISPTFLVVFCIYCLNLHLEVLEYQRTL